MCTLYTHEDCRDGLRPQTGEYQVQIIGFSSNSHGSRNRKKGKHV